VKKILIICFSLFLIPSSISQGDPPDNQSEFPVVVDGDTVYAEAGAIIARGNVRIVYKDVKAFCDEAQVDTKTNIGKLKGNVRIEHEKGVIHGDDITYDFTKKTAEINDMNLSSKPFYAYGRQVKKVSEEEYRLIDGYVTTCDLKEPHYRICAKRILFYPGRKIVAKNVVMKVGKIPVFYIPYYVQPAKDKLPRVTLVPGKDDDMGYYMLSAWRYYFNESFKGRIHLDYYEKKGFGRGITHRYNTEDFGDGIARLYYIDDQDKISFDGLPTSSDRYKAQVRHYWQVNDELSAILEFHKFSDNDFMKDYFYREYERDTMPESYLLLNYASGDSSLSLFTQKRVNKFWTQTEYLPELKFEMFRSPIGDTNLYFDAEYSLANLAHKVAAPSDIDSDVFRTDFYNTLTYQHRFGWLNFLPYIGVRESFYSKNSFGEESVNRVALYSGAELSTKLYKEIDAPLNFLGIRADKTRHIITPILDYGYIHDPTTSTNNLAQHGNVFDSIDTIMRENRITFTLENKLQAKKDKKVWDMLYFAPSVDYIVGEEARGSRFNEVNYDLEFKPFDNLYIEQDFKYDLDNSRRKEMNSDLVLKSELSRLSLGHRYVRDESSQITYSFRHKFSPKWEFRSYGRFESKTGEWEEQQYYIRRDLHCWLADFGVDINEDYGVTFWIIFRIKEFPDIGIGFQQAYEGPKE